MISANHFKVIGDLIYLDRALMDVLVLVRKM